jgi:hypothetical protein
MESQKEIKVLGNNAASVNTKKARFFTTFSYENYPYPCSQEL